MMITGLILLYCVIAVVVGILFCHTSIPVTNDEYIIIGLSMIFWPIFIVAVCIVAALLALGKLAEFLLEKLFEKKRNRNII